MATDQKNFNSLILELPPNIKAWLFSEELAYAIGEINDRIGLSDEKEIIIPRLVLRLVVGDLNPLDFTEELAKKLVVNFEVAKTIAKDIENQALKPMESDLKKDLGLDVRVIYFGKPGGEIPSEAPAEKEKSLPKDSEIYIPKESVSAPTQETKPGEETSEPRVDLKTFEEITPFMLHQEKPGFEKRASSEEGPKVNIKTTPGHSGQKEKSKPVSVRLESPSAETIPQVTEPTLQKKTRPQLPAIPKAPTPPPENQMQPSEQKNKLAADLEKIENLQEQFNQSPADKMRVVHYHQFKTPVNNLGLPKQGQGEKSVDLRRSNLGSINDR